MDPPTLETTIVPAKDNKSLAPTLRSIVRKSALLNLVIILTSSPVLILAGGPKAVVPTLEIMAGISVLIWTATFTLFSLVSLVRIFWTPASTVKRLDPPHSANEGMVADRWLDGPA
jgi:hypothetical protein